MQMLHLLLLGLLAIGCARQAPHEAEARLLLKQVRAENGIDQKEAELIAQAYFLYNVGCGSYESISEGHDFWVVHGKFGIVGTPIDGFVINKSTGAIHSPVGPSYKSFTAMLR